MAVYISVTTDAFSDSDIRQRPPQQNVRRPLRGLSIKEDTYAVLRAKTATGDDIPFLDSGSSTVVDGIGQSSYYSNFLAQQIQEQRVEKQQIVETFGEDYIYFFGERPRFINVTGVLINTKDFNWKSEFWANYENNLRGTRLVEQNARLYFYFDDVVVEGYIVSAATTQESSNPYHLPFQFQMFVCNYAILSTVGSVFFQQDAEDSMVGTGAPGTGVVPDDAESQRAAASQAARQGSPGGLDGFLASASQFLQNADFTIQNTLEVIKNTFYGRNIVVPQGLGQTIYTPPLTNQASFQAAPINRPINEMRDEYVTYQGNQDSVTFDQAEIERINQELSLRTPEQLEQKARQELAKHGIDTTRRDATYTLLGRGAFAAVQTMGAFGIRQVDGIFSQVTQ